MQARGGGTPRAVSTDGRLLLYLRRQASTGASGALLKSEHELGSLGQSRRVGYLVRKALVPSGLDGQLLGEGCQVGRSCCINVAREAMQSWRLVGCVSRASLIVLRPQWRARRGGAEVRHGSRSPVHRLHSWQLLERLACVVGTIYALRQNVVEVATDVAEPTG